MPQWLKPMHSHAEHGNEGDNYPTQQCVNVRGIHPTAQKLRYLCAPPEPLSRSQVPPGNAYRRWIQFMQLKRWLGFG